MPKMIAEVSELRSHRLLHVANVGLNEADQFILNCFDSWRVRTGTNFKLLILGNENSAFTYSDQELKRTQL